MQEPAPCAGPGHLSPALRSAWSQNWLTPGKHPGCVSITGLTDIGGSLLATWARRNVLHPYAAGEPAGFIASVIGAAVLLPYRLVIKDKAS